MMRDVAAKIRGRRDFFLFLAMKSTKTFSVTFLWAGKVTLVPSSLSKLTRTGLETFSSASNFT
jgi:hypothetical protein